MTNYTLFADKPAVRFRKSDPLFFVAVLLLWSLGMVTLYVSTQEAALRIRSDANSLGFFYDQLKYSCVAFVAFCAMAFLPVNFIKKISVVVFYACFILCVMAVIPGFKDERNGAYRCVDLGFISFQPSEFIKPALVFYLAYLFVDHASDYERESGKKHRNYPLFVVVPLCAFIAFGQNDLSTAIFIFCIGILMFIITGNSILWLLPMGIILVLFAVFFTTIKVYRLDRVIDFLNGELNYQLIKSQLAITAGGIWGAGMGGGMWRVASIPEVQSDYIFAGWANAMGLAGVTVYFVLLAFFIWRGTVISLSCQNKFAAYSAFAFTIMIAAQSLLNCAVVCGAVPTTGISLPFFTAGGTSLLTTFAMSGFILNASHCASDEELEEYSFAKKNMTESLEGIIIENE